MSEENEIEEEFTINYKTRLIIIIVLTIISYLLFHFGSWNLLWGDFLYTAKTEDFIIDNNNLAFKLNNGYYGFKRDTFYFNSAFLQWGMLGVGITTMYYSIKNIFKLIF